MVVHGLLGRARRAGRGGHVRSRGGGGPLLLLLVVVAGRAVAVRVLVLGVRGEAVEARDGAGPVCGPGAERERGVVA